MSWYSGYLQGFQDGYLKALEQQFLANEQTIQETQPVVKRGGRPYGSKDKKPRKRRK